MQRRAARVGSPTEQARAVAAITSVRIAAGAGITSAVTTGPTAIAHAPTTMALTETTTGTRAALATATGARAKRKDLQMAKQYLCRMVIAAAILTTLTAWSGTESGSGSSVEIDSGQLVRPGREIEYSKDGVSQTMDVDSIRRFGGSVEIDGTDSSGNSVTLEMDD